MSGYKRFHELTIDLGDNPKRIVALVGPNGCGKSSVFDGMLFLNSMYNRLGNVSFKEYTYHSLHQIPSYGYENVQIELDEGDFNAVRKLREKDKKENTIFSFRSSFRYTSTLKVKLLA